MQKAWVKWKRLSQVPVPLRCDPLQLLGCWSTGPFRSRAHSQVKVQRVDSDGWLLLVGKAEEAEFVVSFRFSNWYVQEKGSPFGGNQARRVFESQWWLTARLHQDLWVWEATVIGYPWSGGRGGVTGGKVQRERNRSGSGRRVQPTEEKLRRLKENKLSKSYCAQSVRSKKSCVSFFHFTCLWVLGMRYASN